MMKNSAAAAQWIQKSLPTNAGKMLFSYSFKCSVVTRNSRLWQVLQKLREDLSHAQEALHTTVLQPNQKKNNIHFPRNCSFLYSVSKGDAAMQEKKWELMMAAILEKV